MVYVEAQGRTVIPFNSKANENKLFIWPITIVNRISGVGVCAFDSQSYLRPQYQQRLSVCSLKFLSVYLIYHARL